MSIPKQYFASVLNVPSSASSNVLLAISSVSQGLSERVAKIAWPPARK